MLDRITGIKVGDIVYAEYEYSAHVWEPYGSPPYYILGKVLRIYDYQTISIIILDASGEIYGFITVGCETIISVPRLSHYESITPIHICNKEMIDLLDEMCWC